jgi:hypothetical protein
VHTGHYISGAGHIGLIGWLLFGGMFHTRPLPFEMTNVSVVTAAEFETMLAAQRAPDVPSEVAQPAAPEPAPQAPEVAAIPDQAIEQPAPIQTETPPVDLAPQVVEQPALPPQTEVADVPPELDQPVGDVAVLVPEVAPRAVPRPVERVAPEPVAQPAPDAQPDPVLQEAITPEPSPEPVPQTPPQEPQEAAAPEEATTEIVTEATQAPKASPRPPGKRPAAPKPQVAATAPPKPDTQEADAAAIAAAVAAAQTPTETPKPAAPSGPPLTAGEKENLRIAVSSCWNVGSLSTAALQTTVVIRVAMSQTGQPITGSLTMLSSSGGTQASAQQAYEAARRAIIRCGAKGFDLPVEKYSQWQTVEMTFNPERMRVK